MKKYLYLLILLISLFTFGQQTYKVTEGELQYIYPGNGIIIKKDNQLFKFKLNVVINKSQKTIKPELQPTSEEELQKYSQNKIAVSYNDISENYDFDNLKKLSFNYTEKSMAGNGDYEKYKLYLVNNNFFAMFRDVHDHKNKATYTNIEDYMPYIYIEFNEKKIIYTYDNQHLYLIPTKKGFQAFSLFDNYVPNYKPENLKITNKEIYEFSQAAIYDLRDDFYLVDTLPTKKVQLKNIHKSILINQAYDSIIVSTIIKCYNNQKIDLYNLTFQKINKIPLKATKGQLGSIQVLEKNKMKWIDWTGKTIKNKISFPYVTLPEAPQHNYFYEVEIFKKKDEFVFKVNNLNKWLEKDESTITDSIVLTNTKSIKRFYFPNNTSKDTVSNSAEFYNFGNHKSKITGMVSFDFQLVYFLKDDGSYGINYFGYFLNSINFNSNDFNSNDYEGLENFKEYQDLQSVEYIYPFYKMKKNNLYKLFGLQKEYRYKKLKKFQGNFSRFELPNGKKGWLDLEGHEYFDE